MQRKIKLNVQGTIDYIYQYTYIYHSIYYTSISIINNAFNHCMPILLTKIIQSMVQYYMAANDHTTRNLKSAPDLLLAYLLTITYIPTDDVYEVYIDRWGGTVARSKGEGGSMVLVWAQLMSKTRLKMVNDDVKMVNNDVMNHNFRVIIHNLGL